MITIPLVPVFASLARHGAEGALDAAPFSMGGPILGAWNGRPYATAQDVPERYALYLGDGDVCPAALGWAQRLLAVARNPTSDAILTEGDRVELWTIGAEELDHRWMWDGRIVSADEPRRGRTFLPGIAPESAAERLKAVLLHEMGRAC